GESDLNGGNVHGVQLLEHTVSLDDPRPFQLMGTESPLFIAQTGLVGDGVEAPGPNARWVADQVEYVLEGDAQRIEVPLRWQNDNGLTVTRRYVFTRDSYVIDVQHEVQNPSAEPVRVYQYSQLRRSSDTEGPGFLGAASYTGGVIYSPEDKYEKISFNDMEKDDLSRDISDGWLAMIQHYFLAGWVPPRDQVLRYYTRVNRGEYVLGQSSPWVSVDAGGQALLENQLVVGPKTQKRLAPVAEGLELTVDYGWLTIISKPLFIALDWIHSVVGNWGWSIILLTLAIKLVFYKLSEASYRSMARMRKLQPEMKRLKERYPDDRQKMNQELMTLYKKEKINPLGGCLPILVQIPVFIALYWVLLESVELRQAPWMLWIQDLSERDPFYILPLLMGATMFLQQKLNPAPMDPIQQKIMMGLPLVFTVFFIFFPAGLVLYWVTNNTLSIAQQWVITRRIEAGAKS
ncbi:MAG: membrane protein insertase YidC, partial [Gammaproteobacteria bacterium]|nr:membrane protein insertase YidC [Gammaproteobacteria bacterium]